MLEKCVPTISLMVRGSSENVGARWPLLKRTKSSKGKLKRGKGRWREVMACQMQNTSGAHRGGQVRGLSYRDSGKLATGEDKGFCRSTEGYGVVQTL